MTHRTPPSRRGPRPFFIPTLTNEEIRALPIWPDNRRYFYQLTEKGKEVIKEKDKS